MQPGFKNIAHRTISKKYPATEEVMERGLLVGCHHGLKRKQIEWVKETFRNFVKKFI